MSILDPRRHFAVDRLEQTSTGTIVVLVDDQGSVYDIDIRLLPSPLRLERVVDGMVLIVPITASGPDWSSARHDPYEGLRRRQLAYERLQRLRRADPGGDLTL